MKDFVKKIGVSLKVGGRPVILEYCERKDGHRAQVTVNHLPLEEGPLGRLKRRYNRLVREQYRQLGQQTPAVVLLSVGRRGERGPLKAAVDADGCPVWRR